jgi:hypothetical protein
MDGHGGQFAIIDRANQLVVVITAEPNTQDDYQIDIQEGHEIYELIRNTL